MTKDRVLTAVFSKLQYPLDISVDPSEGGKVEVVQEPSSGWNRVKLTARASQGYAFDHWEGAVTGVQNPAALTIDSPKTVMAYFVKAIRGRVTGVATGSGIPEVALSYGKGSVSTDSEGRFIIKGEPGPVTITPVGWSGLAFAVTPKSQTVSWPGSEVSFSFSGVRFHSSWGSSGNGPGQFRFPRWLAVNSSGNVYVADAGNYRIQQFTPEGGFLRWWGGYGYSDGLFTEVNPLAVGPDGDVYVANGGGLPSIQRFTSDGRFLTRWGSLGSGDGQFNYLGGVAVDSLGNVYAADGGNNRIQKFDKNGTFLGKWGSSGTGDGQFKGPFEVATDGQSNVYVADTGNYRIQKFASDGTFLTKWGRWGVGDGQFHPLGSIAVDARGNVYAVEQYNSRVQKFSGDGQFLMKWGTLGDGNGQFRSPVGIAISDTGDVYVTDENSRVQRFTLVE